MKEITILFFVMCLGCAGPDKETNSQENVKNKKAIALTQQGQKYQQEGNYKKALECYKEAADLGYAEAQKDLSFFYLQGLGGKVDNEKGLFYAKKAAQGGNAFGMVNLAIAYDRAGKQKECRKWVEKAVVSGHWIGPLEKGYSLIHGRYGYKTNKEEGFKLVKKAAQSRSSNSLWILGQVYAFGLGTKKNIEKAILIFKSAYLVQENKHFSTAAAKELFGYYGRIGPYQNFPGKSNKALSNFWKQKAWPVFTNMEFAVWGQGKPAKEDKIFEQELQKIDPMETEL